jgi:vacuolar-type H+-ATPase subunit C/Vma6
VRRGHPCGAALAAAYRRRGAEPFALDLAASRALVERARRAARRADAHLRTCLAEEVDLDNAWTLLFLGGRPDPAPAREAFLEGGKRLSRRRFDALARESEGAARRAGLARVFSRSALAGVFEDPDVPRSALEARALAARLAARRRSARSEPLGTAPIVAFGLALRAEVADLRRIHWGIVQGLSPEVIARELVAMS